MFLTSGVPRDIKNYFRGSSKEKESWETLNRFMLSRKCDFCDKCTITLKSHFQFYKFLMTAYYVLNRLLYGLSPSSCAFFFTVAQQPLVGQVSSLSRLHDNTPKHHGR
jgi:hypothetical protein